MTYTKCFFVLFLVFCQSISFGQSTKSLDSDLAKPTTASVDDQSDPELKGLVWNRYVAGSYVVLSIDERQGRWLLNNIEKISDSCFTRWGLSPSSPAQECRIFCVPNKSLLKKLFNLDESKAEIRENEDGTVKINVIWVCSESLTYESFSPYLTYVLFSNKYPLWFSKGAEVLSHSGIDTSTKLADLSSKFDSEKILTLDSANYFSMSSGDKKTFDLQAALLCLMLRKELGQAKFLYFLKSLESDSDLSDCLRSVYGYKDVQDLNLKYGSYCSDLSKELLSNKVPSQYFVIKGAQ